MFIGEGFGGVTAIKDHELIASWESEAGSHIVKESGGVAIAIVLEFPRNLGD